MKRWLVFAIVAILLIGGAAGYFLMRGGTPADGQPGNGSADGSVQGFIQVPGGPKIKVVYDGPKELKPSWTKLGMSEFQLHLVGKLTNISDTTIDVTGVDFFLDEEQRGSLNSKTLKPSEQMEVGARLFGYTNLTKTITVRVRIRPIAPAPQPTTAPKPSPTITSTPTPNPTGEWPVKERWEIQTPRGQAILIYRETDSAKGKIKVWVKDRKFYAQNLLDKPIGAILFMKNGDQTGSFPGIMGAKEIISSQDINSPGSFEFWYVIE